MPKISLPRGVSDIYREDMRLFSYITETAKNCAATFGFEEVQTPIFEFCEVFQKSLGESTDVVGKEMYEFEDRKGKKLVLRPEATASILRAASHMEDLSYPARFFYQGPMFRYERPQKGRSRQFHQVGIELLGSHHVLSDVDILHCAHHFLKSLGLSQEKLRLKINYFRKS